MSTKRERSEAAAALGSARSEAKAAAARANGAKGGRPPGITYDDTRAGLARDLYWGPMPLPSGATLLGLVRRGAWDVGAWIRLANGTEVQGNFGAIRTLPRR